MIGKFSVVVNSDSTGKLNALWDDKLKIVKEKESGEQFFRTKIDGTISFVNENFDAIVNAPLETEFEVEVTENETSNSVASGSFFKTDVEFDYDNRIASTKINSRDEYSAILEHLEDEIDVLSLGLGVHPLSIDKRAILQLYILGDSKLTNVIGNQSYEVDTIPEAPSMSENQIVEKKFAKVDKFISANVRIDASPVTSDSYLNGTYSGKAGGYLWRSDGEYYLADKGDWTTGWYSIYNKNGVKVRPSYPNSDFGFDVTISVQYGKTRIFLEGLDISKVVGENEISAYTLFARILKDKDSGFLEKDFRFTSGESLNYRYVETPPSSITSLLQGDSYIRSDATVPEGTKWGLASNGEYFTRPNIIDGTLIPVGWVLWGQYSFWVNLTPPGSRLPLFLSHHDSTWTLPDAYPLFDTIQTMFNYWNIPVIIQDSPACSLFFSGNSSEESEIRALLRHHHRQTLYITPITNLEKTFYDTAARKMNLSLRDIFQMLKGCFNVYWDLKKDERGNTILRLEHLSFYELGLTYDEDHQNILLNTDSLIHPLVGKSWSFGQSKATYDVSDLASRYEFRWPTECTDVFDGFSIQVDNKYVASNQKEEISIPRFFSDVDLVMSTPDSFSDDSIALLGSEDDSKVTRQQFGPLNGIPELHTYFTQNGYLSFLYLELTYHRWSLSGNQIHAEDFPGSDTAQKGSMVAQTVERFKHQTIRIPVSPSILTSLGNIKTPLGIGIPQKISYELDSCIAEIELLQEN